MTTLQRVIGLHLSNSSAHIAVITRRANGTVIATTATFTSRAPRGEERTADLAGCVDRAVCDAQLAITAPADGSSADPLRRAVLAALARRGVQVATVAPTEHTTDVVALWQTVNLASAGELAALQLAHQGAVRQGWVLPTRRVEQEAKSHGRA